LVGLASPWALLPWLSLPLAVRLIGEVNEKDGAALNPLLARTGQVELIFAVLLSAGLLL
jgi:1,4-dihydroxy-2-naphthoate octaprenyltransferase